MSQPAPAGDETGPSPTPARTPDSDLIERITYLASLVSERSAIDKSLDTLRILTSRKGDAPFTPENRATLEQLEAQLKDYLLHQDRLREFNEQELEQRLQQHLTGLDQPKKTISFWKVSLGSLLVAVATILIPTSLHILDRVYVAGLAFMMLLTLWNIYFYRSALGNFKPELKQAFRFIYIGVALLGLQFIHFARLGFTGDIIFPPFQYGGLTVISFSGFAMIYLGLRRYAQVLSTTTILTSMPFFAAAVGLAAVVVSAYGFVSDVRYPLFFSFSLAGAGASAIACLFSAGLAKQIAHSVTTVYGNSMHWLYMFHVLSSIGASTFTVALAMLAGISGSTLAAALGASGIIPILVFAYSGYSFKKETSR